MRNLLTICLLAISIVAFGQTKRTLDVGDFDEVMMRVGGKVFITQGDKNEVVVEGSNRDLDDLEVGVRSGRLIIGDPKRKSWFSWNNLEVDVYVTVKELNGAFISGSGDIISQGLIKSDDFKVSISGSGDIELELDVRTVESKISGSGNIDLKGAASRASLGISGSGKYYAEDLKVDDYKISISGSGRGAVNVSGELDVRISGSGSVYYKGSPTGVNASTAGSGKVRRMR